MKRFAMILLAAASGLALSGTAPKPPFDLLKSDADLARHIQYTEHVFSSAFGKCSGDKVERGLEGEPMWFVYTTRCAIKPLSDTPCPAYSVLATGVIDSPYRARITSLTLAKLCPGQ